MSLLTVSIFMWSSQRGGGGEGGGESLKLGRLTYSLLTLLFRLDEQFFLVGLVWKVRKPLCQIRKFKSENIPFLLEARVL